MNIEAVGGSNVNPSRTNEPAQQVERERLESQQLNPTSQVNKIPPEELLSQIKALTKDGLYSVRFERDSSTEKLVIKIVDSDSEEIIRQIPSEELVNLGKQLQELRGNLVDTVS